MASSNVSSTCYCFNDNGLTSPITTNSPINLQTCSEALCVGNRLQYCGGSQGDLQLYGPESYLAENGGLIIRNVPGQTTYTCVTPPPPPPEECQPAKCTNAVALYPGRAYTGTPK